jgi:lysophospholipase L1-like esterase
MRRVLVLSAVLLLAACARDVPQATREGPIVAFGDSLVFGTGSSGGGFVKLLEQRLGKPILNLGVPGNTTADGIAVLLIGVRGGLIRDNFAERFEALAKQYQLAYVHDVLDDTLGVAGYMADQVHPNDAGYRVIADRVYPVLAKMVK